MRAGRPRLRLASFNEDYAPDDGLAYQVCYRCGINFEITGTSNAAFCRDCNHPDLISIFRPQSFAWIFEREE
jgi:hypothetical protein